MRAFAGAVAELARDGVRRRGLEPDGEIGRAAAVHGHDPDLDGGHETGVDQGAAKVVDLGALERVSRLEPRDRRQVPRAERRPAGDPDRPEAGNRSGLHRQGQGREMRLVVDLDHLLAKRRIGEPQFTKRGTQRELAGDDLLRDHRVPRPDGEAVAQLRGLGPGRLEAGQRHRCEAILRTRLGLEDHVQHFARLLRPGLDDGVIIALAAQQFGEEVGIRARAAVDLRRVGRVLAIGLERRLLAEGFEQLVRIAEAAQAFDRDRIVAFARGFARSFRALRLHGRSFWRRPDRLVGRVEVRPGDAQVRHRIERRGRVELCRVLRRRGLQRRGLSGRGRRGKGGGGRRAQQPRSRASRP